MDLETQNTLTAFLDRDDRDKFIIDWLVDDNDVPKWKAKGIVKLVLAPLTSLAGKVAGRGVSKIHEVLRNRFDDYDEVSTRFAKLLLIKLECERTKQKYSEQCLKPPKGEDPENWKKLNEQTQVWIKQLEQLELISLTLGEMKTQVRLNLDSPQLNKTSAPSRWLRPYNAFIPLIGRDREQEVLNAWRDEESDFSWQIIIGEGGVGKTRLAQEFAKGSITNEWDSGFLDHEHLDRLVNHDNFGNWMPLTDTLIVVDYAATKQESLKKLLHQCACVARNENGQEERVKLRLLLLERHADKGQGWVEELQKAGEGKLKDAVADSLRPVVELRPPQQEDNETMVSLLKATLDSWEKLTGESAPELPQLSEEDFHQLRKNTEGRPLYLQMAALHACEIKSAHEIARWNRATLLQDAVKRERDYISKHCSSNAPQKLVERLAALLFFSGKTPCNHPDLLEMTKAEAKTCGYPQIQPAEIVETLTQLFQEDDTQGAVVDLNPIQPDLIGAAFSATVLQEYGNNNETLDRAILLGRETAWGNLLRSAQDLYGVGAFEVDIWLPSLLVERSQEKLWNIASLLPKQTVALRFFAVKLYEALLKVSTSEVEQAAILNNIGAYYSKLGWREKALDATLKAAEIYEPLAKKNADGFEPSLAGSLNNLGIRYSALGKPDEALVAALKALRIYEHLAKRNPDAFEPDLAMGLNNLSNRYSTLGKPDEALRVALRAVEIRERLAKENPDAFDPTLAGSYNNLGKFYGDLERREEALNTVRKAVEIYEPLAKKNADGFEPNLADSLNNLGITCRALGRWEEALDSALKAVAIYERLAKKNPDAFDPDLAISLGTLGSICLQNNDAEQAKDVFARGIQVLNRLFQASPQAFAGLVKSLCRNYLESCKKVGSEPDMNLLAPIVQKLQELEEE